MDIYGEALTDFYTHSATDTLWINTSYGEPEEMPADIFFRDEDEMPELELIALKQCKGKVLDIGAGAGSHSLLLQNRKINISALEISAGACKIMKDRGVINVINDDIFLYKEKKFDTLLLLMNGIGLCGNLEGFENFLNHAKILLNPGGCIVFDSSDISYLYEDNSIQSKGYYGEVKFQYEYKGKKGDWFNWVYIDPVTMGSVAKKFSWNLELLYQDDHDQYLGKLYL